MSLDQITYLAFGILTDAIVLQVKKILIQLKITNTF